MLLLLQLHKSMYTNDQNKKSCNKVCKCFFDFGLALYILKFLHTKKEEKERKKIRVHVDFL